MCAPRNYRVGLHTHKTDKAKARCSEAGDGGGRVWQPSMRPSVGHKSPTASMRPRARARGIVEIAWATPAKRFCFNEAASARSRNCCKASRTTGRVPGFNEAASARSRNCRQRGSQTRHSVASMRPRARARGIADQPRCLQLYAQASMRPRARARGIIGAAHVGARTGRDASMRPRARARGIASFRCCPTPGTSSFNEAASARSRN